MRRINSVDNVSADGCRGSDLDFMEMIKLINYIRSEVKLGNLSPDVSTKSILQDDSYLKPILEDDPLLYNLHDIIGENFDLEEFSASETAIQMSREEDTNGRDRIHELEERLKRTQQELDARKKELEAIRINSYTSVDQGSEYESIRREQAVQEMEDGTRRNAFAAGNTDSSYFASYAGHGR